MKDLHDAAHQRPRPTLLDPQLGRDRVIRQAARHQPQSLQLAIRQQPAALRRHAPDELRRQHERRHQQHPRIDRRTQQLRPVPHLEQLHQPPHTTEHRALRHAQRRRRDIIRGMRGNRRKHSRKQRRHIRGRGRDRRRPQRARAVAGRRQRRPVARRDRPATPIRRPDRPADPREHLPDLVAGQVEALPDSGVRHAVGDQIQDGAFGQRQNRRRRVEARGPREGPQGPA